MVLYQISRFYVNSTLKSARFTISLGISPVRLLSAKFIDYLSPSNTTPYQVDIGKINPVFQFAPFVALYNFKELFYQKLKLLPSLQLMPKPLVVE
jgi:hypothetical protein